MDHFLYLYLLFCCTHTRTHIHTLLALGTENALRFYTNTCTPHLLWVTNLTNHCQTFTSTGSFLLNPSLFELATPPSQWFLAYLSKSRPVLQTLLHLVYLSCLGLWWLFFDHRDDMISFSHRENVFGLMAMQYLMYRTNLWLFFSHIIRGIFTLESPN